MKPHLHAITSARKFGGNPEDYMDIHNMMDSTKAAMPDYRHRAVFHSAFGVFIIEKIFGDTRVNSAGKTYSVRDVAEQHVIEDLGKIPTLENWLSGLPMQKWMSKPTKMIAEPEKTEYNNEYLKDDFVSKMIFDRVVPLFGSTKRALDWYRQTTIPCLGHKTAKQLVLAGEGEKVLAYLDAYESGGFA